MVAYTFHNTTCFDKESPAISFVGRHNSGKTTLIEQIVAKLVECGYDIGTIKHHGHKGFDIDIPGKDSYRHMQAGSSDTIIVAPDKMARITHLHQEPSCDQLVSTMPNHDLVIVEGFRKSGLETIEVMRKGNTADEECTELFYYGAQHALSPELDITQIRRELVQSERFQNEAPSVQETLLHQALLNAQQQLEKMPQASTVALATNIEQAHKAAELYDIPSFDINDYEGIVEFLIRHYVRPRLSVVIQAGGESKRMKQSKALVEFMGRPLLCHMIERLAPIADRLLITTNEAERLSFVHNLYPQMNIELLPDIYPMRGALPGIASALSGAKTPLVALVACDMVFVSAHLLAHEAALTHKLHVDAVVPVNKHGFEPFHAVYRRNECLRAVTAALKEGKHRAQELITRVNTYQLTPQEARAIEPYGGYFMNANTPEELAQLEERYRSLYDE